MRQCKDKTEDKTGSQQYFKLYAYKFKTLSYEESSVNKTQARCAKPLIGFHQINLFKPVRRK